MPILPDITDPTAGRRSDTQVGWERAYSQHGDASLWSSDPIQVMPEVIGLIREGGFKKILDLGCGDGRNLVGLASAGYSCVGLDLSRSALLRAQRRPSICSARGLLMQGDEGELA